LSIVGDAVWNIKKDKESQITMPKKSSADGAANTESTKAELAAIADTLDRCRERLASLGASRLIAIRDPKNADAGDDLLTAIYEAERGLNTALRLVQRAARQGR
jgi:hypothetical protein